MKAFLLSLLFVTFYTTSPCQIVRIDSAKTNYVYKKFKSAVPVTQSDFKYSVGVKLYSLNQMPQILNQLNKNHYYPSTLNGLLFKINENQVSYRLAANFFNRNVTFFNECQDCEIVKGKITDYSFKLGFEKNTNYGTIQSFFGLDGGYRNNQFDGNAVSAGANFSTPYDVSTEKNSLAITPFIGIKYNVTGHISFAAEAAIDLLYSYERQEKMYKDVGRTRTFQKYTKWEYLFSPANIISIQYNFSSID